MLTACLLLLSLPAQPAPPERAGEEARVVAAIEAGRRALLERISSYDEIEYKPEGPALPIRVRGKVTRRLGPIIRLKPLTGGEISIPRTSITQWVTPGHVNPEMSGVFSGGPSALVAFALLSAGVDTTHPTMALLIEALAGDDTKEAGTYVHSLRACVWSALLDRPITKANRARYRKLLQADADWLMHHMSPDGGYSYPVDVGVEVPWDNSNTQFGNFGLWAAAVGGIEVSDKSWQAVARHWKECQTPSGGWPYVAGWTAPRSSMTVAGCNSLYIVLDRYYSRADRPYVVYEGARSVPKARSEMKTINQAIARGDKFLELQPPDPNQNEGYELFGLERLGLASGRAVIGGHDWFRRYVGDAADHTWGGSPIADAFHLIFLVHGQAPVLFQKLEHGSSDDDWNYYNRDLNGLTRYLSRTFERLHRWQRIPVDAELREMEDAPILYISGPGGLDLPAKTLVRIRQFVDRGGTVFLHADLANKRFRQSAVAMFENLFRDYDAHFKPLEATHPIFSCHFDCRPDAHGRPIPLQALADGPRLLMILCPVDIAGAWHQERLGKNPRLFQIMANVRDYVAPPYSKLPSRLRPDPFEGRGAEPLGRLSLRRLPHAGNWDAHPGAWGRFARGLRHRAGLALVADETPAAVTAEGLKQFDLVHLTVRRPVQLDAAILAALRAYLEGGGLLLIDAADGQPDGIAAVSPLLDSIDVGERGVLGAEHPIVTGNMPGGRKLENLETTKAGASLAVGNAPPPILTRVIHGRVAVLACPFDLIAGVNNAFIWNRSGYEPSSTARLVDNILLWRFDERKPHQP